MEITQAYAPYEPATVISHPKLSESQQQTVIRLQQQVGEHFQGSILVSDDKLVLYAEDYGHIVHNVPAIAFIAQHASDISVLVKIVCQMNKAGESIRIVVRGAGGNVCGASQTRQSDTEVYVLLDMSRMKQIDEIVGDSVWVGAGATWTQVLDETEQYGKRPTILPDYLGITIGGTCSIGGLGADSVHKGAFIDNITDIEVINGSGDIVICNSKINPQLFNAVRGGMGQFGIISRLNIQLELNHASTRVYHCLFTEYQDLLEAIDILFNTFINKQNNEVHTLQTFIIPNQKLFIQNWCLFGNDIEQEKVNMINETNQAWIYMLEMTSRFDVDSSTVLTFESICQSLDQQQIICPLTYSQDMPTNIWDRRLSIISIPSLVQSKAWFKRHPWLNIFCAPQVVRGDIPKLISTMDPLREMGYGHIGLSPLMLKRFSSETLLSLPNIDKQKEGCVYILVLGRDEITDTESGLEHQIKSNRKVWDSFSQITQNHDQSLVRTSVYPTTTIDNWNSSDWERNYSPQRWKLVCETKHSLDPYHIFADTRSFGFSALYQ